MIIIKKNKICKVILYIQDTGEEKEEMNLLNQSKEKIVIDIKLHTIPKKNSQQILFNSRTKRPFIQQSDRYLEFEKLCGYYLKKYKCLNINKPINLKCTFYVPDKRRRDLANLLESIQDILVKYGVIADDNYLIIKGVDGSRIVYEKNRSETIIEIEEVN